MMSLRAGLLGLGVMGSNHARVLASLEGVEFVGVFDPAESVPDRVHGKPVVRDLDEFLQLGLDYVVVAAPTVFHLEMGTRLAEAGVHALIEKPVASTSHDSRILRDLFADKGLIGGVGHIERYNPALQAARQRIEDGMLGEIYQIATRRQGPFPGRIADVGVIKDLATHDIDLTAWVAQQPYLSVNARTTHRSGRPHEDMVLAVGTMSGGTITSHIVNWLTPFKERVTIITGENGVLVADTLTANLTYYDNGKIQVDWDPGEFRGVSEGDVTRFALDRKEPLLAEHEAFRDSVLAGEARGIVTFSEGAAVVEIAEQMLSDSLSWRLTD
ncbi:MAG: Gfo/Idh/MocA family oxidoreductase [Microcella sp.]|uniref:Gfo/Idh/MocA family protein n=1 Tax=Microcella sp. TaxID=1913979 RepID=UPI0024CBFD83|nr:Gfo/Idh/MocA family oxidoreductase [Microcella sp.]UYN82563.1 MAG: Gfo/Idh/MocA family oxidoreductase [Microcella sp.]